MTRKKTDKKIPRLEPQFHNVLVCKKTDCRPFLEILVEKPENISHQNLGILAGIFQIDDRSEDSSYVVNYLISIIKKEYFSRANRGSVENFEAALHKANLALAKLATHENISWIGKINAICAVIEKNNLLISQTGNASVFLLRGTTLMEITELPDESLDSNPLKTFQDVISGKIEKNDKLIFTTKEIFDIFSLEELKKSALKFSRENFLQFLNTALVNELDQVAALVIDIDEKIDASIETPVARKIEEMNVFSQTAFRKEATPKALEKEKVRAELASKKRTDLIREIQAERKDFVDQKTGHIYIKEPEDDVFENLPEKTMIDFSSSLEKLSLLASTSAKLLSKTGAGTKELASSFWQKSRTKISAVHARKKAASLNALEKRIETQIRLEKETGKEVGIGLEPKIPAVEKIEPKTPRVSETKILLAEKIKATYSKLEKLEIKTKAGAFLKKTKPGLEWLKERSADGLILILQKPTRLTLKLIAVLKTSWQDHKTRKPVRNDVAISSKLGDANQSAYDAVDKAYDESAQAATEKRYPWEKIPTGPIASEKKSVETEAPLKKKNVPPILLKTIEISRSIELKKVLPDFSRLKQIVRNLDQKQKISALIVLLLLLFVPHLIVRWENRPQEEPVVATEAPVIMVPLEKDLNMVRIEKLDEVYAGNVAQILNLNNKFFALTNTEIVDLENNKTFSIASDFQAPELFLGMEDLNLIFLVKNNRITSLSPTTGKFQTVNLNFPADGKVLDAKTYLTYIYLLDTKNNQIYRVPRTEGGFGEKTAWLKDTIDLKNATAMAINDNIFVLNGEEIIKFFKYKKQSFAIENTTTSIVPNKLYTEQNLTNLYVLDKTNSRIIKLDNDGKILAQYYNAEISNATDFSVSEENKLVYISDASGVKSFRIE